MNLQHLNDYANGLRTPGEDQSHEVYLRIAEETGFPVSLLPVLYTTQPEHLRQAGVAESDIRKVMTGAIKALQKLASEMGTDVDGLAKKLEPGVKKLVH